ncbi:hypothetical protein [Botrimarina hoheduenensis]|uniref:Uncharacterized protein n=1 Tax=Botrimarina hoheduenensis TaxID=2528000 RepID=A0A5C5W8M8_9BACT|nr:hypothetical protein [Botrimarina hoheduenensis]TWT46827.1 hypothetical protein Pla111_19290 [Botrimarina hoheduenensis]
MDQPRQKPRLVPWLLGAVVLGLTLFAWRTLTEFDRRVAQLRSAGQIVTLAELRPQYRSKKYLGTRLNSVAASLKQFDSETIPAGDAYRDLDRIQEQHLPEAAAHLERYREALAGVQSALRERSGSNAPIADYDAFTQLLYQRLERNRSASRLLMLQHAVLLCSGKRDEAAGVAIDLLELGRQARDEPFIVGGLTALAMEQIGFKAAIATAQAFPDDKVVAHRLDAALAGMADPSRLDRVLREERVLVIAQIQRGNTLGMRQAGPVLLDRFEQLLRHGGASRSPEKLNLRDQFFSWLADLVTPAIDSVRAADDRVLTLLRCARLQVALAAQQPPLDSTPTAESLGLRAADMLDPMTGKPLRIEHREVGPRQDGVQHQAGWWVWGVGTNLIDEGGELYDYEDWGYGPPLEYTDSDPDASPEDQ